MWQGGDFVSAGMLLIYNCLVCCCCRDGTLKEADAKATAKVVDPEAQAKDGGSIDVAANPDGPLTWQQSMRNVSFML